MINQENDTLNANQQNSNEVNNAQQDADKSRNKNAMVAKLFAAAAGGAVIGSGTTYAATTLFGNKSEETETQEGDQQQETETQEANQQQEAVEAGQQQNEEAQATPTTQDDTEERLARIEEQERIRQQHEAERQHQEQLRQQQEEVRRQQEELRQQQEETRQQEEQHQARQTGAHEIKIESIERMTDNEGNTVNVAMGTVDGHQAVFVDDGNGNLMGAAIDVNDNGLVDESEIIDLSRSEMTMTQLAEYRTDGPEHEPEVRVVAVEHDVELNGETVDIAAVTIEGEDILLVDTEQTGEVSLMVHDDNHSGTIEENEIVDVSDAHIAMPTEDDITGNLLSADCAQDSSDCSNGLDNMMCDV